MKIYKILDTIRVHQTRRGVMHFPQKNAAPLFLEEERRTKYH